MAKDIQIQKSPRTDRDMNVLNDLGNMDRIVDRFFADSLAPMFSNSFAPFFSQASLAAQPRTELRETNEAFVLTAEVPGIPKDAIEIDVSGNRLSIRAESRKKTSEKGETQRTFQSFQASYSLPTTIDAEHMEAHCEDGVLEILMPKKASAQSKKISVQSGKGSLWDRLTSGKAKDETSKPSN